MSGTNNQYLYTSCSMGINTVPSPSSKQTTFLFRSFTSRSCLLRHVTFFNLQTSSTVEGNGLVYKSSISWSEKVTDNGLFSFFPHKSVFPINCQKQESFNFSETNVYFGFKRRLLMFFHLSFFFCNLWYGILCISHCLRYRYLVFECNSR